MRNSNNTRIPKFLILAAIATVSVMTYTYLQRTKVVAICRDVRVHMDGTYSAVIQSGGLLSKSFVSVYRLKNLHNKKVAFLSVEGKAGKYFSSIFELDIGQKPDKTSKFPAKFMFRDGNSKKPVQAKMGCMPPQG